MNTIKLHIAGRTLELTQHDAAFLAEHLRTAAVQPNTALSFRRNSDGENGQIQIERRPRFAANGGESIMTDC